MPPQRPVDPVPRARVVPPSNDPPASGTQRPNYPNIIDRSINRPISERLLRVDERPERIQRMGNLMHTNFSRLNTGRIHSGRVLRTIGGRYPVYSTRGDGGCFFHSISQWIFGNEMNGPLIRMAVIEEYRNNPLLYANILNAQPDDYIERTRMNHPNTYATEHEILAVSRLFHCEVWIFRNGEWNNYSLEDFDTQILLYHSGGQLNGHFEAVGYPLDDA
jgi:hypothetical protein